MTSTIYSAEKVKLFTLKLKEALDILSLNYTFIELGESLVRKIGKDNLTEAGYVLTSQETAKYFIPGRTQSKQTISITHNKKI